MTAATRARRDATLAGGEIGLLGAILTGVPALPRAACRGQHHLFDPAGHNESPESVTQRHSLAVAVCATCPELAACRRWLNSLPARARPPGVTAGIVNQPTRSRK